MTVNLDKHAFLILAHRCDKTLGTLLRMLDDERNDVFLHMDAKCANYEPAAFAQQFEHAAFYSIPRRNITWGGLISSGGIGLA